MEPALDLHLLQGRYATASAHSRSWAAVQVFEQRQAQVTMDGYLAFSQRFAKIKSSRLQKALAGTPAGQRGSALLSADLAARIEGGDADAPKAKKPRKRKANAPAEPTGELRLSKVAHFYCTKSSSALL